MRLNHGGFAAWPRPASLKALTFAGLHVWVRVRFGHQVSQRSQMPLHPLLLLKPGSGRNLQLVHEAVRPCSSPELRMLQLFLSPLKTFNLLASIYYPGMNIK